MKPVIKIFVIVILLSGTTIYLPSCKKEATLPVVATTNLSDITQTTALIEGILKDDGEAEITEIGFCWSTSPKPTISSDKTSIATGIGSFTGIITGLTANTTYNVRAYATNIAGTGYGNGFTFTTKEVIKSNKSVFNPDLNYGEVSDIDGNTYKTIQIGNQIWMAENLRTTKFNDGKLLPNITGSTELVSTPGYCWYNNDFGHKDSYGAYYNWFTVKTDKLCPGGWHVPSNTEWATLLTYIGVESAAIGKLMETGNSHWLNPNTGATNSTGFTGLPGGFRIGDYDGFNDGYLDFFTDLGYESRWWLTSEAGGTDYALTAGIYSREDINFAGVVEIRKNNHVPVRCVKDN